MLVLVNGEKHELIVGVTVESVVAALAEAPGGRGVAVAVDGEVVPRGSWAETELTDGARVEIVAAVQGG